MSKIPMFVALICWIYSCRKSNKTSPVLSGIYAGVFVRHIGGTSLTSSVQFIFSGNNFTGTTTGNFPIICSGNFQTTNDSIIFLNPSVLPDNTDESIMLGGKYKLRVQGDSLIFSNIIGDFIYEEDVYSLTKQ
jgi:hypothetical protein